jgi:hypothetical protein
MKDRHMASIMVVVLSCAGFSTPPPLQGGFLWFSGYHLFGSGEYFECLQVPNCISTQGSNK